MNDFNNAFIGAYQAGLQRRWAEEQEAKRRKEQEDEGNSLKSLILGEFDRRNQAIMAPKQQAVDTHAQNALSAMLENSAWGTGEDLTDEQKQAYAPIGQANFEKAKALQTDYNLANSVFGPGFVESLNKMGGAQFAKVLPYVMQLDQNRVGDYQQQQKVRQYNDALDGLDPETQGRARALAAGVPAAAFRENKPFSVAPGTMIQDTKTGQWTQIGTAPKQELSAYEKYKIDNGLVEGRGGGSASDRRSKEAMFRWASGYDTVATDQVDWQGKPITTRKQRDPQLAAALAAELGYVSQNTDQPQAGQQQAIIGQLQAGINADLQSGKTREEIAAKIMEDAEVLRQNGIDPQRVIDSIPMPQAAAAPKTTTAQYMGETVQGAPVGYTPQLPQQNYTAPGEDEQIEAWRRVLRR